MGKKIKVHKKDGSIAEGEFYDVLSSGDLILKSDSGQEDLIPFYVVEQVSIK